MIFFKGPINFPCPWQDLSTCTDVGCLPEDVVHICWGYRSFQHGCMRIPEYHFSSTVYWAQCLSLKPACSPDLNILALLVWDRMVHHTPATCYCQLSVIVRDAMLLCNDVGNKHCEQLLV
jgi:hypothetical protein